MQVWENLTVWRTTNYPAARPGLIFSVCLLSLQSAFVPPPSSTPREARPNRPLSHDVTVLWIGLILGFKHKARVFGRRPSALAIDSDLSSSAGRSSSDVDDEKEHVKDDVEAVFRAEELQKTARLGHA